MTTGLKVQKLPELKFLSELYAQDAPDAILLAEYPSSNSSDTAFRNESSFIIHDPFPPPNPALLKVLGPHHLMCAWGNHVPVTSQVSPPDNIIAHWADTLGIESQPVWQSYQADDMAARYITLFPHESIPAECQLVDPAVNYELHSKEVIEKIDCPQAAVYDDVRLPCIAKLTHGYAGLGNYLIEDEADAKRMRADLKDKWPDARLVFNSIIENIVGDYGVQFYLRKNGEMIWLGFTEQDFDSKAKWSGGRYSSKLHTELFDLLKPMVEPAGQYLHQQGYFGVVGIDILRDKDDKLFLVDVNPRLTGISPFLMAARLFNKREGLEFGTYRASCQFTGSCNELISKAQSSKNAKVLVLSAFEVPDENMTIAHLSVSSNSQEANHRELEELLGTR